MGRRKAVAARRAQAVEINIVDVHQDDAFPDFVLDFFQRQYFNDNDDAREDDPPAKRRKLEPEPQVEYVAIIKEELSINRPTETELVDPSAFILGGLQSLFIFNLDDGVAVDSEADDANDYQSQVFTIATRPYKKNPNFSMKLPLGAGTVSSRLTTIIKSRDTLWSNPNTEDAIWISVDAGIESTDAVTTLTFSFQVNWNISSTVYAPSVSPFQRKFRGDILALAFPDMFAIAIEEDAKACHPRAFYEAAHVPDPDDTPSTDAQIPGLATKLYPFQRRAVKWMLRREGVEWGRTGDANTVTKDISHGQHEDSSSFVVTSFVETKDAIGRKCFVSPLLGKITRDLTPFQLVERDFRGGILSEEMGLGKTVELLALFALHPQPPGPPAEFDQYLGELVKSTRATLIVAPSSLKMQWLSELRKHAPGLHVMHYTGLDESARQDEGKANALIEKLQSHDVVVTTYTVLTTELNYALGEPDRARRNPRKYHRPRSPLTQLRWWRVCMDEAQMIESGVSRSATLARLLPRVNAWGVTGTPVKDSVEDLRGLLLFLRYEPFASNIYAWNTLVQSHKDAFKKLFNRLSLRHSKRLVRHEIAIPAQKRYVITMPFTAVEEQFYQALHKEVINACGLSATGEPLRDDWDPEDPGVQEKMRIALDRLRKTALHPEVGRRNRRALGRKAGPMRTVAEVLDVMIEQNEVSIRADQRALLSAKLTRGQLMENSPRVKIALELWQEVLDASQEVVADCRKYLQHEIELAKAARDATDGDEHDSDDDVDEQNTSKIGDARRRLRSALEIQHKAIFFVANANFQIKSNREMTDPDSDEFHRLEKLETEGYDNAKVVRREILEESRSKALRLMKNISASAENQSFATIPEYRAIDRRGLESRALVEDLENLAGELNFQAGQVDEWREHVIQILLDPLVDEESGVELTGEEYEESMRLMDETVVYITILRCAIADREEAMSGQTNELVKHEAKMHLRLAKDGEGPFPERLLQLFAQREEVRPQAQLSLRAAVGELRTAANKLRVDPTNRAKLELAIISEQMKATQKQLSEQQKVAAAMNQELELFTATMNARVDFYRQLQNVSDMVAPYEGPIGPFEEGRILGLEETLARKLDSSQAKHRYLLNLKDMDAADEESRMCVICRDNFTIGVLTVCGHQFCKECIVLFRKTNHNCPVCRKRLHASSMHDITLKPQELRVRSEGSGAAHPPKTFSEKHGRTGTTSKTSAIYTEFNAEELAEIKNINLEGPAFTSKVDNLVRHLLWLRENDPGAKSIVFSQYTDFLSVLCVALQRYRIGSTSLGEPNSATAFQEDPSLEVFLLHARSHASGLNLTRASHVFLMEPLVNTALELQAIARVHRIGQEQETTVWLYIVDGTVEESIYDLSVRRRMGHMGYVGQHNARLEDRKGKSPQVISNEAAVEAANSLELEQASLSKLMGRGREQGEEVDKGDIWECLFGHVAVRSREAEQAGNPGPAVRGFLAAEAAERRLEEDRANGLVTGEDDDDGDDGDVDAD